MFDFEAILIYTIVLIVVYFMNNCGKITTAIVGFRLELWELCYQLAINRKSLAGSTIIVYQYEPSNFLKSKRHTLRSKDTSVC